MEPPKIILTHSTLHERQERFTPGFLLKIIGIGIILMAVIAGLLWWSLQQAQSPRGVLARIEDEVGFPLYYPTRLPQGMTFDKDTVSYTKGVVTTSYTYDGNKRLVVTFQPMAKGFDAGAFNPTSEFTTSIGRAYVADLPIRTTAAVVGEKSWVLLNATEKIAIDQLTAFINGLQPVK